MNDSDRILERLMALHPKVIDLSLDRMHRILDALGHPERNLPPVIHVAGTNGKGSTQAMIRAGLESMGLRVHAYTSPHLARFHERIRIAGQLISEPDLAALLEECEAANGGLPITFFEITTAAGLLAFSRIPADYILLEVGLGGRLDATNVIDRPRLSVITPVSIDHTQFLGETIEEIAAEKAGIIKPGVTCVVARQSDAAMRVIERQAARLNAPLFVAGQDWHVGREDGSLVWQDERGLLDLPLPNLVGPFQIENAGTAIAALRVLGFGEAQTRAAVTRAEWPARMQRLHVGPLTEIAGGAELWLDGGHNPAGGEAVAAALTSLPARPTHLVCGMLNTKDIGGYLRPLARASASLTAVAIPEAENSLAAEDIAGQARASGFAEVETAATPAEAIARIAAVHPDSRILICGSLYLAGFVLRDNG